MRRRWLGLARPPTPRRWPSWSRSHCTSGDWNLRPKDLGLRTKARLDLLEVVGSLLLFGGSLLSRMVGESWFWPGLAGFPLLAAVYAVKGVHWLRTRRHPTA
ncbi:hypothetical protein TUSST3_17080 [Streptomyces sp. TUS-ST3]|nr:hypothetical protein TUSST3_17080 [Streptomyces sp. TUS-ST3]